MKSHHNYRDVRKLYILFHGYNTLSFEGRFISISLLFLCSTSKLPVQYRINELTHLEREEEPFIPLLRLYSFFP